MLLSSRTVTKPKGLCGKVTSGQAVWDGNGLVAKESANVAANEATGRNLDSSIVGPR